MDFFLASAATFVSNAMDKAKKFVSNINITPFPLEDFAIPLVPSFIPDDMVVPSAIVVSQAPAPTDPAYIPPPPVFEDNGVDMYALDEPNFSLVSPLKALMDAPVMHDLEAFVTPTAPTAPVAPMAPSQPGEDTPLVLTHTVTISGGDRSTRRNLALEFARVAAPRPAGKRTREPEVEEVTRSGRPIKVPKHFEEYVVRSDLLDSDEE